MTDTSPKRPRGTMPAPAPTDTAKTYWDGFHQSVRTPADWVARPNPLLVDEVSGLQAGTALDLGCGAGGDAIWLAQNGWRVTAVDVSAAVLAKAATAAARAGVGDRIDWQEHDLTRSLPAGTFGLVTAQYLHSPIAGAAEREAVFASAATTVAPGGTFLVISHVGFPTWLSEQPPDYLTDQLVPNSVILDWVRATPGTWTVDVDKVVTRDSTGPAGETGTADDAVLRIRRLH